MFFDIGNLFAYTVKRRIRGFWMKIKLEFIEKHLAFILTILITYVFGGVFILFETINSDEGIIKILIDNFVPTTITYVLGCVLVNIVELLQQDEKSQYVYNIFTCFAVIIYALIFTIYLSVGYAIYWLIIELLVSAAILFLNVKSYQEKFKTRNHGIV